MTQTQLYAATLWWTLRKLAAWDRFHNPTRYGEQVIYDLLKSADDLWYIGQWYYDPPPWHGPPTTPPDVPDDAEFLRCIVSELEGWSALVEHYKRPPKRIKRVRQCIEKFADFVHNFKDAE